MKKFSFVYPKSAYIVSTLVFLSGVIGIVFASLRLSETAGFLSAIPALDILTIVIFSLFLSGLGWILFGSYYAFDGEQFVVARLFFRHRIDKEAIFKLVIDESTGFAALYYLQSGTTDVLAFVTVNLKRRDLEPFADALRAFKEGVFVEYNSPLKEEK